MNSNRKYNEAAVKQFRKELQNMFDDITEIDKKILNIAVNKGAKVAKQLTPVGEYSNQVSFTTKDGKEVNFTTKETKVGGFMRRSWRSAPAVKSKGGAVTKSLVNSADYSEFVNYGHRIVNKNGETVGWVKGQFMLEKAIGTAERELVKEFKEEVERINKKHDK